MKWLNESMSKSKKLKDTHSLHDIEIFIKDQFPESIDMDFVLKYINAMYMDGAIYITNDQDDDMDLIDDIIHEIAHSVEELYGHGIYDDGAIQREFLAKRKRLYADLKANDYGPPEDIQYKTEYVQEIDDYLYKDVTYDAMWHFVGGLFPSPYAATSLREYFARGFEEYVMGNKHELAQLCPVLSRKLSQLHSMENE